MLTRKKLVAYHDSYAQAMAKYGLQPGVRGSEARHVSTAQYYRDLKRWTGELEADNHTLQNEIAARDENIELLQEQMQCQQEEYHRQLMEIQAKHRKEVSLLKTVISKAAAWFPYFRKCCTWRTSASK